MPQFIDRHRSFPRPDAAGLDALRKQIEAPANKHGVKGVNVFMTQDGGSYCLMDAPSRDAVLASHHDNGVPLEADDIQEYSAVI